MSSGDTPVRVQFVGDATLLLRYGPLTLLTDPNFLHRGQHAHRGYGLLTKRLSRRPAPRPRPGPSCPGRMTARTQPSDLCSNMSYAVGASSRVTLCVAR